MHNHCFDWIFQETAVNLSGWSIKDDGKKGFKYTFDIKNSHDYCIKLHIYSLSAAVKYSFNTLASAKNRLPGWSGQSVKSTVSGMSMPGRSVPKTLRLGKICVGCPSHNREVRVVSWVAPMLYILTPLCYYFTWFSRTFQNIPSCDLITTVAHWLVSTWLVSHIEYLMPYQHGSLHSLVLLTRLRSNHYSSVSSLSAYSH